MYAMRMARTAALASAPGYYDPKFRAQALKVLPGEYLVSGNEVMLVTVLGSCVAACMRDPLAGVGGMNHFMLPQADADAGSSWGNASARYGSYAMELLINALLKRGADRRRLEVKVFGGAAVIAGMTASNVGERNARFVLDYLRAEGLVPAAQDLFDVVPRRVHYFPRSGRVLVRRLPVASTEVIAGEDLYRSKLQTSETEGAVELFS